MEVLDVFERLGFRGFETCAGGLVLYEELALPEQIDEAVGTFKTLDGLLKGSDGAAREAKDKEEVIPEGLLVGLLAGGGSPLTGESNSALTDFIPGKARLARL